MVVMNFWAVGCFGQAAVKQKQINGSNSPPSPNAQTFSSQGPGGGPFPPLPCTCGCSRIFVSCLSSCVSAVFCGRPGATGQRTDFCSLIIVIWLIYLLNLQWRKALAEVWPRCCAFLISLMTFQYFLGLRRSPAFCRGEPRNVGTHGTLLGEMLSFGKC